jgi:DNA-directed RNA polymerase subunit RPC12/RpoP
MDSTMIALIAGAVVVAGVIGYLVFRWMSGQKKAEGYYHYRCTGCKRRLRYQARQVGRKGRCSHCSTELTLPDVAHSVD